MNLLPGNSFGLVKISYKIIELQNSSTLLTNNILQSECSNTIKNSLCAFRLYAFIGNTVMSVTNFSTKASKLFKNSIKETLIEVTVDNEGSITFFM